MQFSGFIEASGNATSTEEVFQLLGSTVLPFGCSRIAFFALTEEAQRALAPCAGEIAFILASNYPEEYLRNPFGTCGLLRKPQEHHRLLYQQW